MIIANSNNSSNTNSNTNSNNTDSSNNNSNNNSSINNNSTNINNSSNNNDNSNSNSRTSSSNNDKDNGEAHMPVSRTSMLAKSWHLGLVETSGVSRETPMIFWCVLVRQQLGNHKMSWLSCL